jgi:hypothetical protein
MLDEYTITDLEKLLLKIRHIGGLLLGKASFYGTEFFLYSL